jgi:sugar lactone lactonase YvrE
MAEYRIDAVVNSRALLGESPHYDPVTNEVIWVDCDGGIVNFFNCSDKTNRQIRLDAKVAIAIPTSSGRYVIANCVKSICLINRNSGSVKELCMVEPDKPLNRFNDAKCDQLGRLWYGTLYPASPADIFANKEPISYGGLYTYDGVAIKQHLWDIGISNGIDWSLDGKTMYYIDSFPRKIYSFDFDLENGTISNQVMKIDYLNDASLGLPDGMCRDEEGKLWVAGNFCSNVTRWDPDTGEKLMQIQFPVKKITACCFGGPNYDVLYVTSGIFGADEEELEKYPLSGALFAVYGLGIKGLPVNVFDDSKCNF